jgi:hypothetical protein
MITAKILLNGKELSEVELQAKEFSTGSKGYHKSTKVEIEGERYQLNFMLVKIGSKNKVAEEGKKADESDK